jgi:hypothetical protein
MDMTRLNVDLTKGKNIFNSVWALAVCMVCIYIVQWHAMPLYPDEVAYTIDTTRFIFDDSIRYGLYAECPSNAKIVPWFFYPAALVLAGIGALPYWKLVRVVPYVSLIVLIVAVFLFDRRLSKSTHSSLFITAGFIGVAGSGMVLSRPEAYLIFHGAICLYAYSYIDSGSVSRKMAMSLLMMLYMVSLISFFVHLQGFIFAPLTLMLMYKISKSFNRLAAKVIVVMATSYISLAAWYGLSNHSFRCPESPRTSEFISLMTLPGWLKSSSTDGMSTFLRSEYFERFAYFDRFKFGVKYQIDYLPQINFHELNREWFFQYVNNAVVAISGFVLVAFLILCFYLIVSIIMQLRDLRYQSAPWLSKISSFAISNKVIFLTTCLAHLCLLFFATQLNFYRIFYINLAMVVLLLVALNQTMNKVVGRIALTIGISSFMLCGISAFAVHKYIAPKLESGYSGPSIPLATNWAKVNKNVRTLKISCGISDEDSGVIIDDKTYDAMKKHRHLFHITYMGLFSEINGIHVTNLINSIDAKAAVARCDYFDTFHIPSKNRVDDLCCTTFNQ